MRVHDVKTKLFDFRPYYDAVILQKNHFFFWIKKSKFDDHNNSKNDQNITSIIASKTMRVLMEN